MSPAANLAPVMKTPSCRGGIECDASRFSRVTRHRNCVGKIHPIPTPALPLKGREQKAECFETLHAGCEKETLRVAPLSFERRKREKPRASSVILQAPQTAARRFEALHDVLTDATAVGDDIARTITRLKQTHPHPGPPLEGEGDDTGDLHPCVRIDNAQCKSGT